VALLHDGQLLALDTPAVLRTTLPGPMFEVIATDHRQAAERLRQIPGVRDVEMFGERAHVRTRSDARVEVEAIEGTLRRAGLTVESIRPITASLEDVFIARLTGVADSAAPGAVGSSS
jgi:ABC-2 type transport system ATP-binding protein